MAWQMPPEFMSTRFNYIQQKLEGLSDVLIFRNLVDKEQYKVYFVEQDGWFKTVSKNAIPVQVDYIVGFTERAITGFRIYQGSKITEWVKEDLDKSHIIT